MSEQEKIEKIGKKGWIKKRQKVERVKKDESKKDKLVKSSEKTKKVELVREDESKKEN